MQQVTSYQQLSEAIATSPVEGFVQLNGCRSVKTFTRTKTGRVMMHNEIDGTTQRVGQSSPRLREYIAACNLFINA